LRTDWIQSWQASTPKDAPNRFVINVMPEQTQDFLSALNDAGVKERDWYPMIRGRLSQINGKNVSQDDYTDDQARRMVDRDFNLSFSETLPSYDTITQGQWVSGDTHALSLEEGLAKTLHIKLGDVLSFDIAGVTQTARVTSIRAVNWTSMRVNFFVMFPLKDMPSLPTTFISAFKAPQTPGFDAKLNSMFPNITTVDMSSTLDQIQNLLNQVIAAVQALFVFTLAAGMLVLFATVTLSRTQRLREQAIFRALGATTELLSRVQRTELLGVGALSGFLASALAWILGALLAHDVFDFTWTPSLWIMVLGALAGSLLSWSAGAWSLHQVLKQEVVKTLRQAPA
jgi:putative ABC transport system permease protein